MKIQTFSQWLIVTLIFQCQFANAFPEIQYCRNIFVKLQSRMTKPIPVEWAKDSLQWQVTKSEFLPSAVQDSQIFTRSEVKSDDLSFLGINSNARAILLSKMTETSRLVLTPLGPSLWEISDLRDWLYLGETRILKDGIAAQEALEEIAVSPDRAPSGFLTFWVNELHQSSIRLDESRQTIDASKVYFSIRTAFQNLSTIVQKNLIRKPSSDNSFDFAWGSDSRWLGSTEMPPRVALSVAQTLAILTLIEKTYVFSDGVYQSLGNRDRPLINLETKLFFATYPEYFPLITFFQKYPIEFGSGYRIGSADQMIHLFPATPFRIEEISFRISSSVSNQGIALNLIFDKEYSWNQKEFVIDRLRGIMTNASSEFGEIFGRRLHNKEALYFNLLTAKWFELKLDGANNHELALIHIHLIDRLSRGL